MTRPPSYLQYLIAQVPQGWQWIIRNNPPDNVRKLYGEEQISPKPYFANILHPDHLAVVGGTENVLTPRFPSYGDTPEEALSSALFQCLGWIGKMEGPKA